MKKNSTNNLRPELPSYRTVVTRELQLTYLMNRDKNTANITSNLAICSKIIQNLKTPQKMYNSAKLQDTKINIQNHLWFHTLKNLKRKLKKFHLQIASQRILR